MHCPVCTDVRLEMADRRGVEIDYCPKCRGVWLDRGELDKIIERAAAEVAPTSGVETHSVDARSPDGRYKHKHKHKRKSLLGELFDF